MGHKAGTAVTELPSFRHDVVRCQSSGAVYGENTYTSIKRKKHKSFPSGEIQVAALRKQSACSQILAAAERPFEGFSLVSCALSRLCAANSFLCFSLWWERKGGKPKKAASQGGKRTYFDTVSFLPRVSAEE